MDTDGNEFAMVYSPGEAGQTAELGHGAQFFTNYHDDHSFDRHQSGGLLPPDVSAVI